jgi:hypothetical protein
LQHDADLGSVIRGCVTRIGPEDSNIAGLTGPQADTHLDSGGLSGPIWADKGGDVTGSGSHREPVDHRAIPVPNEQVTDLKRGHAASVGGRVLRFSGFM